MNITDIFPGATAGVSNITIPNSSIYSYENGDSGQQLICGMLERFHSSLSTENLNNLTVSASNSLVSEGAVLQRAYEFNVKLNISSILNSINTVRGYSLNDDAQYWHSRVITNGGSVSESTLLAVNNFCNSIDDAGLRSKFLRLNLFCGSNLETCFTPLYLGPSFGGTDYGSLVDQNNGPFVFEGGDYVERGSGAGLSSGSSFLDTGLDSTTPFTNMGITYNNIHGAAYLSNLGTEEGWMGGVIGGNVFGFEIGDYAGVSIFWGFGESQDWNYRNGSYVSNTSCPNEGLIVGNLKSSNNIFSINNTDCTNLSGVANVSGIYTSTKIYIMRGPSGYDLPGDPEPGYTESNDTVAGYSLGLGLTSSEMTDYNNIMTTFQTALERNI